MSRVSIYFRSIEKNKMEQNFSDLLVNLIWNSYFILKMIQKFVNIIKWYIISSDFPHSWLGLWTKSIFSSKRSKPYTPNIETVIQNRFQSIIRKFFFLAKTVHPKYVQDWKENFKTFQMKYQPLFPIQF